VERRAVLSTLRLGMAILGLVLAVCAPAGERQVVLVVSASSPVLELHPIEIRKLFLGLPVQRENRPLVPVRNSSDRQLEQVFLQDVVAMSQSNYDRRILAQTLQHGRPRPLDLQSRDEVLARLYSDRFAVSYVWFDDAASNPRLRILRVIWSE
jgi:hypothetical protein